MKGFGVDSHLVALDPVQKDLKSASGVHLCSIPPKCKAFKMVCGLWMCLFVFLPPLNNNPEHVALTCPAITIS